MLQSVDIAAAYFAALHQHRGTWAVKRLHHELRLPWSSVHLTLQRLRHADVVIGERVRRNALVTLLPALQYLVPARPDGGVRVRGVPTGAASPVFAGRIVVPVPLVWACELGSTVGVAIDPLYRTIPEVAVQDPRLHALFGALDAARTGRSRDLALAREILADMVGFPEPVGA